MARRHVLLAAMTAWVASCCAPAAEPPTSAEPAAQGQAPTPLVGTSFTPGDADFSHWRAKENTRISLAQEGDRAYVRVQSDFGPFAFAWVNRRFQRRPLGDAGRLRVRLRGDGSGHLLELRLGVAAPDGGPPLYYVNRRESLRLSFAGWKTVTLDLARFRTPANGRRSRDLDNVAFVELMVYARGPQRTLDLGIGPLEWLPPDPEVLARKRQQQAEAARIVAQLGGRMDDLRARLKAIGDRLPAPAAADDPTPRLYYAALAWCVDDLERTLAARQYALVSRAPSAYEAIRRRLDGPDPLGRAIQPNRPSTPVRQGASQAAESPATEPAKHENPFVRSVWQRVAPYGQRAAVWPKGSAGFASISDPWQFRRLGEEAYGIAWSLRRSDLPARGQPALIASVLSLLDLIAQQHTEGDFNVERSLLRGHDPNINRFCLMPALDAWYALQRMFPELLPEAQRDAIDAGLRQLVDRQWNDYGSGRLPGDTENRNTAYPNMDAHYVLIMELAHRLWNDPRYAKERDIFLGVIEKMLYPGGAIAYVDGQNDCCVYHGITVMCLGRYAQLTGDPRALAILRRTVDYYPYSVEPAGMPEYFTDPSWKHYWVGCDAAGPSIIASLFRDGRNRRLADTCVAIWRRGRIPADALAADLAADLELPSCRVLCEHRESPDVSAFGAHRAPYEEPRPEAMRGPLPLPDGYVRFDENIQGPRGRYGPWSFAGNGRLYVAGEQGKDTFVGAMLTDAARRPLPLAAALQVVTAEVRLRREGTHWKSGRFLSAEERLSTVLGPQFGSLAVRYTVSPPYERRHRGELLPWQGTQQWYLGSDRLVGLVALEAVRDDRRAGVWGRIRLGLDRAIESVGPAAWRYGGLVVKLHGHNYAAVETRPSETRFDDPPSVRRSTEITLLDRVDAEGADRADVHYRAGSRWWFLVEVRPESKADGAPAGSSTACATSEAAIERIERLGLHGFRIRQRQRQVLVLHNPGQQTVRVERRELGLADNGWTRFADRSGQGEPLAAGDAVLAVEPGRHIVLCRDAADAPPIGR